MYIDTIQAIACLITYKAPAQQHYTELVNVSAGAKLQYQGRDVSFPDCGATHYKSYLHNLLKRSQKPQSLRQNDHTPQYNIGPYRYSASQSHTDWNPSTWPVNMSALMISGRMVSKVAAASLGATDAILSS